MVAATRKGLETFTQCRDYLLMRGHDRKIATLAARVFMGADTIDELVEFDIVSSTSECLRINLGKRELEREVKLRRSSRAVRAGCRRLAQQSSNQPNGSGDGP